MDLNSVLRILPLFFFRFTYHQRVDSFFLNLYDKKLIYIKEFNIPSDGKTPNFQKKIIFQSTYSVQASETHTHTHLHLR